MKYHPQLSGSRMGILRQCAWWADPANQYREAEFDNTGSDVGTAVHELLCQSIGAKKLVTCGDPEVDALVKSAWDKLEERGIPALNKDHVLAEPAFAWSIRGGARKLGENIGRAYEEHGLMEDEIPCSLDLVYCDTKEDVWVISDYKTGHADVDPPAQNEQLRFGALCVRQWLEKQGARVSKLRLEVWKVRKDRTWVDEHTMNLLDLVALERETALLVSRVSGADAHAGGKCSFCPALGACPETARALGRVVELDGVDWTAIARGDKGIETVGQAAAIAQNLTLLSKGVEQIKKALQKYVESTLGGELPLPNGKVYKQIKYNKNSLNTKALKAGLGDKLAPYYHETPVKQWKVVNG